MANLWHHTYPKYPIKIYKVFLVAPLNSDAKCNTPALCSQPTRQLVCFEEPIANITRYVLC
jgi:hypothetical protein